MTAVKGGRVVFVWFDKIRQILAIS